MFHASPDMPAGDAFPFIYLKKCFVFVRYDLSAAAFRANIEKTIIRHTIPLLNTANLYDHEEYNNVSDGVHLKLLIPFPHFSNEGPIQQDRKNEK